MENIKNQRSALKDKILLMPIDDTHFEKEIICPTLKLSAADNILCCSSREINPHCFSIRQLNDSLEKPPVYATETCMTQLHEEKLRKFRESNCICPSSTTDMAPIYAVEIAKLWIRQNSENAAVSIGHKTISNNINIKERNEHQMKDIGMQASGEEATQSRRKSGNIAASLWHKRNSDNTNVTQTTARQMTDIGVMTSSKEINQCQQNSGDNAAVSLGPKINSDNITVKQRNEQQMAEIGVMTSSRGITQCQQKSGNTSAVSLGHKTNSDNINVKQRNEHQMKDICVMTSDGEVTQCQPKSDNNAAVLLRHKTISDSINVKQRNDNQLKDVGVMTSDKEVTQSQPKSDNNAAASVCHKTNYDNICVKERNEHQMNDIGVMTAGKEASPCQPKSDNNIAVSQWRKTNSDNLNIKQRNKQQMKDMCVMTSDGEATQCQQKSDNNAAVPLWHKTNSENINVKQRNEEQVAEIGVMTPSREISLDQQTSRKIAVVSPGHKTVFDSMNVIQRKQVNDVGVMTSGEKVTQCHKISFSTEPTSHIIMDIDGRVDNGMQSLSEDVAKCCNTDQMLNSGGIIQAFQKNPESDKYDTTTKNVNCIAPASVQLEKRDRHIVKHTKMESTKIRGQNETMEDREVGNSCSRVCRSFSERGPTNVGRPVNKYFSPENNSYDNIYPIGSETTPFARERTEKLFVKSHPIICNVIHTIPLKDSGITNDSRLLISEGALLHKKNDGRKPCLSQLQHGIDTQDTTRMSGYHDTFLVKTTSVTQLHPSEAKYQYELSCGNGQQTNKALVHQEKDITNRKVNKINYFPHTDFCANKSSEEHHKRESECTNSSGQMNTLGSQGNSLVFTNMEQHVTYNMGAQNIDSWLQETSQKVENDTKLRMKSYKSTDATEKLNGGLLENECLGDTHLCGQRDMRKVIGKNNSLYFKKRNQMSVEGTSMVEKTITFTNVSRKGHTTKRFTKKRSMWSFFRNLLKTLEAKISGCSTKREEQTMYKISPASLTLRYKILNKRELERERIEEDTHGLKEKQPITSNLGHHRNNTIIEKEQIHNYTPGTSTSAYDTPSNLTKPESNENIKNNHKKHSLTHLYPQYVYRAFTGSSECDKSLQHFEETKPIIIDNKQMKFNEATNHSKGLRSQTNHYNSSKANNHVHDNITTKKKKYCGQADTHTIRKQSAKLRRGCKYDRGMVHSNVTIPFLFKDETYEPRPDEDKNILVMVEKVHRSDSKEVVNHKIMEELRKQRQEINNLRKLLDINERKKQHTSSSASEVDVGIMPDFIKNFMNCQSISDSKNAFRIIEQPTPKHVLKTKGKNTAIHDTVLGSVKFKDIGQVSSLKLGMCNHDTDSYCGCADGYTRSNNARHRHRRAEKKHLYYTIQHCKNCKMDLWHKIFNLFTQN